MKKSADFLKKKRTNSDYNQRHKWGAAKKNEEEEKSPIAQKTYKDKKHVVNLGWKHIIYG